VSAPQKTAWERRGLMFRAEGQRDWMRTHAQMPHAEHVEGDVFRIYFTCRDAQNRSHIAWLMVDLARPEEILELSATPLLAPGPIGRFDDVGVMTSCMVRAGEERRFYTIGWNIKTPAPMHTSIGLACATGDGAPRIAQRYEGPVFERNRINPYYVSCPWVLQDGDGWRMWYMNGIDWGARADGTPASRYNVWHARSDNGLDWTPDRLAIDLAHPGELAIARPQVLRDADCWRMWHCYRGADFDYRIGYAESADGEAWMRRDDHALTLLPDGEGFDANATCYPFVFDHGGERWMLYCGDRFGQAGFGLARQTRKIAA
jgi:hypothetical protein